jgi:NTP pyrophosphatase (non-canonical NTP hydrolase)
MEIWEYTTEVLRTYAGSDDLREKLCLGALGLGGESGEVIDLIKKALFQGHELDSNRFLDEVGDVLWYLALICDAFGYSLEAAMIRNVYKLRERYPDGFDTRRSINRE